MSRMSRLILALGLFVAGLGVSVVLAWWLMRLWRGQEEAAEYAVRLPRRQPAELSIPLSPPPAESVAEKPGSVTPDDLTRIDGIGPKYAAALQAVGIRTYGQLAAQDPEQVAARLKAEGVRVGGDRIKAEDWIGQAGRLAAG